jgi:hypothetical protein
MAKRWYIATDGPDGATLFAVDRNKCREHWWTALLETALAFRIYDYAKEAADNLKFNNPRVVDREEALVLEQHNIRLRGLVCDDPHPYSEEAFQP